MTEPQITISPLAILAAVMFAARHEVYADVEPGVKKLVKRIALEVDPETGAAVAVLDPQLLFFFASTPFRFSVEPVAGGQAFRVMFRPPPATSLLSPNGQAASEEPNPAAVAALKLVLG